MAWQLVLEFESRSCCNYFVRVDVLKCCSIYATNTLINSFMHFYFQIKTVKTIDNKIKTENLFQRPDELASKLIY